MPAAEGQSAQPQQRAGWCFQGRDKDGSGSGQVEDATPESGLLPLLLPPVPPPS